MKGEDQGRIEKFLEDYRAMKPTRFTYADIKRITNGFSQGLGEGAHEAVFKGMLSREILVAVKILNDTVGDGKDFINEVGTIGKIHHVNVVRLLGFCADGFHRALVYHFFPNGSLQQIALGIAKGIEYLHLGCDHRILHFDFNPHNILIHDEYMLEGRDVQISVEDEGDVKIAKKLAIVGLRCIQWNPVDRPSTRTVVQMLEGDGGELISPLFLLTSLVLLKLANTVVPARCQNFELEVIHEIEE